MKKIALTAVSGVALLAGLGGWTDWEARERVASARPPRADVTFATIPSSTSTIRVNAELPYQAIANLVNQKVAGGFQGSGRRPVDFDITQMISHGEIGKFFGFIIRQIPVSKHVTEDVHYTYTVVPSAAARLSPTPTGLDIELPMHAEGGAGFGGELARMIGASRKNFRGDFLLHAHVTVNIGDDWCPQVVANTDARWISHAQLEVIKNNWVNLDNDVKQVIDGLANDIRLRAAGLVSCSAVQSALNRAWQERSVTVPLPGTAEVIYANFKPTSAYVTPTQYGAEAAIIGAGFDGSLDLSSASELHPVSKLPAPKRYEAVTGDIHLEVPTRAHYDDLSSAIGRLLRGRTFIRQVALGKISVAFDDVSIYPTSDQELAIALHFTADAPLRLLGARGWVYLKARPAYNQSAHTFQLEHVSFTHAVDNEIWQLIGDILRDRIESDIEGAAIYQAAHPLEQLHDTIDKDLVQEASVHGAHVALTNSSLSVGSFSVDGKSLDCMVSYRAKPTLQIDLTQLASGS